MLKSASVLWLVNVLEVVGVIYQLHCQWQLIVLWRTKRPAKNYVFDVFCIFN